MHVITVCFFQAAYYFPAKGGHPAGGFLQNRLTTLQRKDPNRKKRPNYGKGKQLTTNSFNEERAMFFSQLNSGNPNVINVGLSIRLRHCLYNINLLPKLILCIMEKVFASAV